MSWLLSTGGLNAAGSTLNLTGSTPPYNDSYLLGRRQIESQGEVGHPELLWKFMSRLLQKHSPTRASRVIRALKVHDHGRKPKQREVW